MTNKKRDRPKYLARTSNGWAGAANKHISRASYRKPSRTMNLKGRRNSTSWVHLWNQDDLFADFGNTSNFLSQKKSFAPRAPNQHLSEPLEEIAPNRTIKELVSILSDEWLDEVKISSEAIQVISSSTIIKSKLRGISVDNLYNPTIGANVISESFACVLLGHTHLASMSKIFKEPSGLPLESRGVARDVFLKLNRIEVPLNFHTFGISDFDLLIRYPIKKLLLGMSSTRDLRVELGHIYLPFNELSGRTLTRSMLD